MKLVIEISTIPGDRDGTFGLYAAANLDSQNAIVMSADRSANYLNADKARRAMNQKTDVLMGVAERIAPILKEACGMKYDVIPPVNIMDAAKGEE